MSFSKKYFDAGTMIVLIITLLLFIAALFTKGFTHDLFLEAGVFLVSVKIILLSYQNRRINISIENKLDNIIIMIQQSKPGAFLQKTLD